MTVQRLFGSTPRSGAAPAFDGRYAFTLWLLPLMLVLIAH
jgi:hypothetical protein